MVDTWHPNTVMWYWSADTLFWQLSIDHNIKVFLSLPDEYEIFNTDWL